VSGVLRLVGAGRRQAEALMLDSCTIRPVLDNVTDPVTGVVTPSYGPVSYTGKCKIQAEAPVRSNPAAGEHVWVLGRTAIHLPVVGSGDVASNQLVVITASVDPSNVGRQFRVHSGDRKSLQTAFRLLVEEVLG
jgi:Family of unknown function (DUF6093)